MNNLTFCRHSELFALMQESFPTELMQALREALASEAIDGLEEIRLRAGRDSTLTIGRENRLVHYIADSAVLARVLTGFCRGSVYAYRDTLRQGYVPLPCGARLGVVGRAVTEGESLCGVGAITAMCLRIPHRIVGIANGVIRAWYAHGRQGGILVFAPPAGGKTTLLRDMIAVLSSGLDAMRLAVVDTRGELCPAFEGDLADVLTGYPRALGMEIALRTLSPQAIVCDEIGADEVESVLKIAHSGVPLIASVHATDVACLLRREGGRKLLESGAFDIGCVIERQGERRTYRTEALECFV